MEVLAGRRMLPRHFFGYYLLAILTKKLIWSFQFCIRIQNGDFFLRNKKKETTTLFQMKILLNVPSIY